MYEVNGQPLNKMVYNNDSFYKLKAEVIELDELARGLGSNNPQITSINSQPLAKLGFNTDNFTRMKAVIEILQLEVTKLSAKMLSPKPKRKRRSSEEVQAEREAKAMKKAAVALEDAALSDYEGSAPE